MHRGKRWQGCTTDQSARVSSSKDMRFGRCWNDRRTSRPQGYKRCHEKGRQCGVAALELALLLPILLLLCTLAVEMGHVYWVQGSLQIIAREGAQGLSRAQAATFGAGMSAVKQQMQQDLDNAGLTGNAAVQIQLSCLDSTFAALGSGSWCTPGGSAPADAALAYVQAQVTLSVPSPGAWMPFYTVLTNGSSMVLTGEGVYPYGT